MCPPRGHVHSPPPPIYTSAYTSFHLIEILLVLSKRPQHVISGCTKRAYRVLIISSGCTIAASMNPAAAPADTYDEVALIESWHELLYAWIELVSPLNRAKSGKIGHFQTFGVYAGRRTDFQDKKSRDFSGEIFLERFFWSSITARTTLFPLIICRVDSFSPN